MNFCLLSVFNFRLIFDIAPLGAQGEIDAENCSSRRRPVRSLRRGEYGPRSYDPHPSWHSGQQVPGSGVPQRKLNTVLGCLHA